MNKHRLYRRSKKIQGRGFFSDIVKEVKPILRDKLNEIFSKKKKGAGLKIFSSNK